MAGVEGNSLVRIAGDIERKLDAFARNGFIFEFGKSAIPRLRNDDLDAAWSLLEPLGDYAQKTDVQNIFRLIVDWTRDTQRYAREKWGASSVRYQRFKTGNQNLLNEFRRQRVPSREVGTSFTIQASEFKEIVEEPKSPIWKRILVFLPDILRIVLIMLGR